MAQSGYTPILIYGSGTPTNVPSASNLISSASGVELALNYADGKLFYKDSGGVVQVLATKGAAQNSISFGSTGLTPSTATQGAVTVAGTLITSNGGTGLSSYTAGDLPYYASGTALSKLAIGTSGQILTSGGTAPQWSTLSGVAVTTFSAGTTGFTPSSATSGAITLAGTLAVTNGGTGLTTLTSGYIPYGNGTSAFGSSANLFWDSANSRLGIGTTTPGVKIDIISANNTSLASVLRVNSNNVAVNTSIAYDGVVGSGQLTVQAGTSSPLIFGSNATEQMRLTSAGYLGIGTSSPSYTLDVNGTTRLGSGNSAILGGVGGAFSGGQGELYTISSYNMGIGTTGAGSLRFYTNSVLNATLDSSGILSLGITPYSGANVYPSIFFGYSNQSCIGAQGTAFGLYTGIYYNGGFKYSTTGNAGAFFTVREGYFQWNSTGSTTGTAGGAASPSTYMTLDNSGNLLVGGTSQSGTANRLAVFTANKFGASIIDTTAQATGVGGALNLGGNYRSAADAQAFCRVAASKENSTDANYAYAMTFSTTPNGGSFTEAARIDSSGNFMVGGTGYTAAKITAVQQSDTVGTLSFGLGAGGGVSQGLRLSTNNALAFDRYNGGWAESMRIDSSGNVGIGTSSPSCSLTINGTNISSRGQLSVIGTSTSARQTFYSSTTYNGILMFIDTTGGYFGTISSTPMAFATADTERMRIDSSGNLLVGTTTGSLSSGTGVRALSTGQFGTALAGSTNATDTLDVYSTGASAYRFYVDMAGTVHATSTSITAISDQTLKTNVKPLETGLAEVMRLQPRRFDWLDQTAHEGTNVAGFIAQEVQEVLPDLVGDFKYDEGVTKLGLKMGDMIPTLVKAIQEQQAIIEQLKAKVGI